MVAVYTSEARIEAQIGDLFEGGDIDTGTSPTTAEVLQIIEDIEAEMHVHLEQNGYSTPIVVGTNANAFNYTVGAATHGACVVILRMLPAESYTLPGEEGPAQGRGQFHEQKFSRWKKLVDDQMLPAARDVGLLGNVFAGSQKDSDGNTKVPLFKRDQFDFPGSRSLTEE